MGHDSHYRLALETIRDLQIATPEHPDTSSCPRCARLASAPYRQASDVYCRTHDDEVREYWKDIERRKANLDGDMRQIARLALEGRVWCPACRGNRYLSISPSEMCGACDAQGSTPAREGA